MAEQQSRLAIIIDSTGARRSADSLADALAKLTTKGERTTAAAGRLGVALGAAVAAGAVTGATALAAMIKSTADAGVEISKLSRIANASNTEFQRYAVAAGAVGISQEKLSDILKDVNDKVGDFMSTGGGEMADFFKNIAPRVGVTADQFRNLSGPQALQLYVNSLQKANLSQADMTFYMEAIANDGTALLPVLQNNGQAMNQLADQAQKLGIILDDKTIRSAQELSTVGWLAESAMSGLKTQIAAGLMPTLSDLVSGVFDFTGNAVDATAISGTLNDWIKNLAKSAVVLGGAFMGVSKTIGGFVDIWKGIKDIDLSHPIDAYGKIKDVIGDVSTSVDGDLSKISNYVDEAWKKIDSAGSNGTNNLIKQLTDYRSAVLQTSKVGAKITPAGSGAKEDAGQRILEQLREEQTLLMAQLRTGEQLDSQQQALIKWETQLANLKEKKTLTAEQKSVLASADQITAQLKKNAGLASEIQARERILNIQKAQSEIDSAISSRQGQYANEQLSSSGTLNSYQLEQYQRRYELEKEYNDRIAQLRQQRAAASTQSAKLELDEEIRLQQQAMGTELANYDAHIKKMDEIRGSFTAGASRSWQEYKDSAANVSGMSEQLFTNAIGGMEDALVKFVTTGKASFTDFANSVLADLARIAIRQSLVGIAGSASGMFGSIFGSAAGAASSASASSSFSSGAYNNLSLNAKGGVYDSPSLSAYSGGVYDSPKLFAFAKGAGVFGEAGPEAIMPLTRSSDGSLGVRMVGGDQAASVRSGDTIIHQTIQVSGNGDAALQRAMEEAARKGATDGAKQARQDMLQDFQNRGQGRRLLGV